MEENYYLLRDKKSKNSSLALNFIGWHLRKITKIFNLIYDVIMINVQRRSLKCSETIVLENFEEMSE